MATSQLNARIDAAVKKVVEEYCRSHGLVISRFVQDALIDRLEELEDVEDLKRIRHEPTRPLAELVRELERDGEP